MAASILDLQTLPPELACEPGRPPGFLGVLSEGAVVFDPETGKPVALEREIERVLRLAKLLLAKPD